MPSLKMRRVNFIKMVASGNDFILVRQFASSPVRQLRRLAKNLCDRKYGVGADGLLILDKSKAVDVKMRIFNPDGSEPAMCGNGARCVVLFTKHQTPCLAGRQANTKHLKIETKAGIIEAEVEGNNVKIRLPEPKDLKLDLPIIINGITRHVSFINTGVPHTVIFVSGLDKIDVVGIGRLIRYHKKFSPQGTNVNFVEIIDENNIYLRIYERGVEDETLACGTGAVAAAIITVSSPSTPLPSLRSGLSKDTETKSKCRTGTEQSRSANNQLPVTRKKYKVNPVRNTNYLPKNKISNRVNVKTKSGEILKVYFEKINHKFKNVWLEGKAKIVYKGVYYV